MKQSDRERFNKYKKKIVAINMTKSLVRCALCGELMHWRGFQSHKYYHIADYEELYHKKNKEGGKDDE